MDKPTPYIVVQVSTDSSEAARTLARTIVERKLAASAQIFPIQSVYTWKGQIAETDEYAVLMKSRHDLYPALAACIRELHTYEVPEILVLPMVDGWPDYLAWIDDVTTL